MQRHGILSRDGEAARQILVPQIDFTLLSPSGGRRYESSTRHALSSTTHSDRVRRPLSGRKKQLGRWKSRKEGGPFQSSLRFSEMGTKNALPRPLEQSFSRLTRASAALVLGPVLQPQYSLSRKLSDNTECRRHQIRKTNLTLQQLSINSNSRYFGEIMRSVQFRISPVRLTDCQIRSSDLSGGVENQHLCINNHSQRGLPHYSLL